MKKVLFVGYKDPLHSSAGGYDKITGLPNSFTLWDYQVLFGSIPMHKRGKVLNTTCLDLKARFIQKDYDIIHYFYGDMLWFPFWNKKSKIVATLHLDIKLRQKWPEAFIKTLRSLDGLIVLSSNQKQEIESNFGIKAKFIPHGFSNPEFIYTPSQIDKNKINVVISGTNYRDTELMLDIISFCEERRDDIVFHLLGQSSSVKSMLKGKKNAICYQRLPDDEYYSIISDCDYSFLPLTFATANNALLEAEFLNTVGIYPNISGIKDYAAPEPYNIFYDSKDNLIYLFERLSHHRKECGLGIYARQFLWDNIYIQLLDYYNNVIV